MNWEERIRQSDAGKLNPARAEEIVSQVKYPKDETSSTSKVKPEVLKGELP